MVRCNDSVFTHFLSTNRHLPAPESFDVPLCRHPLSGANSPGDWLECCQSRGLRFVAILMRLYGISANRKQPQDRNTQRCQKWKIIWLFKMKCAWKVNNSRCDVLYIIRIIGVTHWCRKNLKMYIKTEYIINTRGINVLVLLPLWNRKQWA